MCFLSHNDVHLLSGIFSSIIPKERGEIEVILGKFVLDEASQTERDVDIVIKTSSNIDEIFTGIEVKDEKRNFCVAKVEQLCSKLNDMPSLNRKAIISSSPYTETAKRKALYHGIELFELREWSETESPFKTSSGFIKIENEITFSESIFSWDGNVHIILNYDQFSEDSKIFEGPVKFFTQSKGLIENIKTFQELADSIKNQLLSKLKIHLPELHKPSFLEYPFKFEEDLVAIQGERKMVIKNALVQGAIINNKRVPQQERKALYKVGENEPYFACNLMEDTKRNLKGLVFCQETSDIRALSIPAFQRDVKIIKNIKLR